MQRRVARALLPLLKGRRRAASSVGLLCKYSGPLRKMKREKTRRKIAHGGQRCLLSTTYLAQRLDMQDSKVAGETGDR